MKISTKSFLIICLLLTISSCQEEGDDDSGKASIEVSNLTATIDKNSLLGDWELSYMRSDTLVDLDGDGFGSYNLLDETSCFQNTGVTFNGDGSMETTNAKLDFRAGPDQDEFICTGDGINEGTWDIDDENNELLMTMEINGTKYTHRKKITQTDSTFAFKVEKYESDQYVEDPGDSHASDIEILSLEYTKVQ